MASQGPNFPSTGADDASIGTAAWSNPGNITADDGVSATNVHAIANTTHYLKGTGFGFSIPANATILGILLEIKRSGSAATANDNSVKLVKGGTISGNDKATGTTYPASLTYASYGSGSDLWGLTWAPSDINAANFGAVLSSTFTSGTISVDAFRITVTYSAPNGPVALVGPASGSLLEYGYYATTANAAISSGVFRINPYSLHVNPSAAAGYAVVPFRDSTGALTSYTTTNTPLLFSRFYLYVNALPTVDSFIYSLGADSSGTWTKCLGVKLTTAGKLNITDSTGAVVVTGTTILTTATWHLIQVQMAIGSNNNANLSIDGKGDSTAVANFSNTVAAASFGDKSVNGSFDCYFCDLLIRDDFPPPGGSCYAYVPNGVGHYTAWTATGAATLWQSTLDLPNDGDTTYADSTTAANNFSVKQNGSVPSNASINGAKVCLLARTTGAANIETLARSGSTDNLGALIALTTSYAEYAKLYVNDPATSAAWTSAGLNGLEIGAQSESAVDTRATAVYLMVDYQLDLQSYFFLESPPGLPNAYQALRQQRALVASAPSWFDPCFAVELQSILATNIAHAFCAPELPVRPPARPAFYDDGRNQNLFTFAPASTTAWDVAGQVPRFIPGRPQQAPSGDLPRMTDYTPISLSWAGQDPPWPRRLPAALPIGTQTELILPDRYPVTYGPWAMPSEQPRVVPARRVGDVFAPPFVVFDDGGRAAYLSATVQQQPIPRQIIRGESFFQPLAISALYDPSALAWLSQTPDLPRRPWGLAAMLGEGSGGAQHGSSPVWIVATAGGAGVVVVKGPFLMMAGQVFVAGATAGDIWGD